MVLTKQWHFLILALCGLALASSACLRKSSNRGSPAELAPPTGEGNSSKPLSFGEACAQADAASPANDSFKVLRTVLQLNTCAELEAHLDVQELDLSHQNLVRLQAFTYFTKLKYLDLSGNPELELAELGSLKKLESLRLNKISMTTLQSLPALPSLRSLILSDNTFSGELQLPDLARLEELDLINAGSLQGLKLGPTVVLKILRLNATTIINLEALLSLTPSLQELYIRAGGHSDLKFLQGKAQLKKIDFSENSIAELEPLSSQKQLSHIWASNNQIIQLGPLAELRDLQVLHLMQNKITDKSPLAGLSQLWDLDLSGNPLPP